MIDYALEANRRLAWARFYRVRDDLETVAWWAVELAEYASAVADLPPAMVELVELIGAHVAEHDRGLIAAHVRRSLVVAA